MTQNIKNEDIIETIRMESVMKRIESLVKEMGVDEKWINHIFHKIYQETSGNFNIRPKQLLYDKMQVHNILSDIRTYIEKEKINSSNNGEENAKESQQ